MHEFDLWNEVMLFQSRFPSYFVGFTLAWRLFLSLSFLAFYSVHQNSLCVEVCVFPSLSVRPSSSPVFVARSCSYSSCVPMFLFLSGSISLCFLGSLWPAFLPRLFFNVTCIWVVFCKNISSVSLTNVFVWLQASLARTWGLYFNVQRF